MKREGLSSLAEVIPAEYAVLAMAWMAARIRDAADARDNADKIMRDSTLKIASPQARAMFREASDDLRDLGESWEYELGLELRDRA